MNAKKQAIKYILLDYLSAAAGWNLLFIFYRQYLSESNPEGYQYFQFLLPGLTFIPLFWLVIYYISGYYRDVYLKSRLTELWQTIGNILIGVTILFIFFLNKMPSDMPGNNAFFSYFLIHFFVTYLPRLILTTYTTKLIHKGVIGVNTLIIGSGTKALKIFREITSQKRSSGNRFSGFITADEKTNEGLKESLTCLGTLDNIGVIIDRNDIREVIIAIESSDKTRIINIINMLVRYNVVIKAIPSMSDIEGK
jgi:FlaA1/EpsC-like NDP-sugar epimerase